MIVRISGVGQYELDDDRYHHLHELDAKLTDALHAGREEEFHRVLHELITVVQGGKEIPHDTVVPSDIIVPPDDVTLDEAQRFFTDEGLTHPIPA